MPVFRLARPLRAFVAQTQLLRIVVRFVTAVLAAAAVHRSESGRKDDASPANETDSAPTPRGGKKKRPPNRKQAKKKYPARRAARRTRIPRDWPLPPKGAFLWSEKRPELKNLTRAEEALLLCTHELWDEYVKPLLDEVQRGLSRRGGRRYSTEDLERLRIYIVASGNPRYESRNGLGVRDFLTGDRSAARKTLGFGHSRNRNGRNSVRLDGVPAGSRLTAHRNRMDDRKRRIAYERVLRAVVRRHLNMARDEITEEACVLHMDGVPILIRGTCPIYKDGELQNKAPITCPDGGYLALSANVSKPGPGFLLVILTTSSSGLPLAYFIARRHGAESKIGRIVLRQFARTILPHLGDRGISILTTDGAFHSPRLRTICRQLGIIENIALASHKHRRPTSEKQRNGNPPARSDEAEETNAAQSKQDAEPDEAHADANDPVTRRDNTEIEIEPYPNWYADGHRDILCKCGLGTVRHRAHIGANGYVYVRTEGTCDVCGPISIRSGDYRRAQNPDRFVACHPRESDRVRDWLFGNPLTFHDRLARAYGGKRFGHNEGFNSALGSHYGLISGKRKFENIDQVRAEVAIIFILIHLRAMLQRLRASGETSG